MIFLFQIHVKHTIYITFKSKFQVGSPTIVRIVMIQVFRPTSLLDALYMVGLTYIYFRTSFHCIVTIYIFWWQENNEPLSSIQESAWMVADMHAAIIISCHYFS